MPNNYLPLRAYLAAHPAVTVTARHLAHACRNTPEAFSIAPIVLADFGTRKVWGIHKDAAYTPRKVGRKWPADPALRKRKTRSE